MPYYLNKKGYKAIDEFLLEHAKRPGVQESYYFQAEREYMQGEYNHRDSHITLSGMFTKTGLPVRLRLNRDYFAWKAPYTPYFETTSNNQVE